MVQGDAAFRTNTSGNFLGFDKIREDLQSRPRLRIDLNHFHVFSLRDCLPVQTSKHFRPETFLKLGGPLPFVYEGETA
jgi:hypothetical protein